jgi:transcription antitermination factor NusG
MPVGAWIVLQVAPRSERRVASILGYKGYEPLAPTYLSRKRWSDRIKTLEEPLFPGYIFVQRSATTVSGTMCSTPGVVRLLSFEGRPSPVPDSEIDAIRRFTLLGKPSPTPFCCVGQNVQIKGGPFAGIVGIVRQIRNRACLIISVQLIAQSICIDVTELQVEPVAC